ncbi:hypothetical protein MtrunA17_Chr8g0343391 [Medicago truncatula]|uniref:Uncharacterized protein n=1 Tax=Medicago truncatula TaxID=3880 RepID=A0A396GG17_MEDTR|nr:hypothetical protein MtrunA17_Chr8g0343391 [Medicago truncatula]
MSPVCGTNSSAFTHTNATSSLLILPVAAQPCNIKHNHISNRRGYLIVNS